LGKQFLEADIRHKTGCNVIAYSQVMGGQFYHPDPNNGVVRWSRATILIGDQAERDVPLNFFGRY